MGKKHDLLLDDDELIILQTKLAVAIGDRPAIALQQVHYWLEINRKANKETHFYEGLWWVYNTWNEWHEAFPFWSVSTIRRIFAELEDGGLITSRAHENRNKGIWVTINYEALKGLSKMSRQSVQNEQTSLSKMDTPPVQIEQSTSTTDTTENSSETTHKEEKRNPLWWAIWNDWTSSEKKIDIILGAILPFGEVQPEQIKAFVGWYKTKNPTASLPLNEKEEGRVSHWWGEYLKSRSSNNGNGKHAPAPVATPTITPDELAARKAQGQAARKNLLLGGGR